MKVTDTLPAGVALVSVTPSQGTCSFGATVICQLGSLTAGGAIASVTLVVKPSAAGTAGQQRQRFLGGERPELRE